MHSVRELQFKTKKAENSKEAEEMLRDVDTVFPGTLPEAEQLGKESSKGEKGSFFPLETNGD